MSELNKQKKLEKMGEWAAVIGERNMDGILELDIMNVSDSGHFIEY